MKCPKCQYLGFDTGARCRNCGYDFSLLALGDRAEAGDVLLRPAEARPAGRFELADPAASASLEDLALSLDPAGVDPRADALSPPPAVPARTRRTTERSPEEAVERSEPAATPLPLFSSPDEEDAPLVRMPAAPRNPVAVRKTPEVPRVVRPPTAVRRDVRPPLRAETVERGDAMSTDGAGAGSGGAATRAVVMPCAAGQRALAATIDAALLGGLHLLVLYFTIRMAGLTLADWRLLPPAPLLLFFGALTIAYFAIFTVFGGQTIGKMATDIRVVSDEGQMSTRQAVARALAATGSIVVLGAGLLPAFVGDGRALHDRVARTRVVVVRSAA